MIKDMANLNFQFLIVARNLANEQPSTASISTGLPKEVLTQISEMSLDQLEKISNSLPGMSIFSMRITSQDLEKLAKPQSSKEHAVMAILKNAS